PDTPAFSFYAQADGEYWFTVCVVDRQGRQELEDVKAAPVSLKTLVDTLKPEVRITAAERVGDEIQVRWEARDDYLDPTTLKLESRTPEMPVGALTPVMVSPQASGQTSFRPGCGSPVQLRLQVSDMVGNVAMTLSEVPGAAGAQS